MKRFLTGLLALIMVLSAVPARTFAETTPTMETTVLEETLPEETLVETTAPETQPEETEPEETQAAEETTAQETEPEETLPEETVTEEETPVPETEPEKAAETMEMVTDANGSVFVETEETITETASEQPMLTEESSLPQLGTPADLEWGFNHNSWVWDPDTQTGVQTTVSAPGYISWKVTQPEQAQNLIEVYRVGEAEPVYSSNHHFGSMETPEWRSVGSFCTSDPESGTYYFTVKSIGDDMTYRDSETATSATWTYVKPNAKVATPAAPVWDWPYANCSALEDMSSIGGWEVMFLYASREGATPSAIGWVSFGNAFSLGTEIMDHYVQQHGNGYYYAKVRALSADINTACNGEWSEMSAPYKLGEVVESVEGDLEDILNNAWSREEVLDSAQNLDTTELKSAMLADQENSGVVDQLAQLEENFGLSAGIEVTEDAVDFDPSQVSVIGAGLNGSAVNAAPVTLVIDKPEGENVIPEAYNNSVAVSFSMDLTNVEDTENLKVPVKITLPIPASINHNFLVILHYHANGTVEEIQPHVYWEYGQFYASFVLTSFSDFVMTQDLDLTGDGDLTEADAVYLLWYTLFPDLYPVDTELADLDDNGQVTDADAVKLLWAALFSAAVQQ